MEAECKVHNRPMWTGCNPLFDLKFYNSDRKRHDEAEPYGLSYRVIDVQSVALPLLFAGEVDGLSLAKLRAWAGIDREAVACWVRIVSKLEIPEPEVLREPWVFRAACHLKEPQCLESIFTFRLVLDLGFHIYHQIKCQLLDLGTVERCNRKLVEIFAANWAENGNPNPLEVTAIGRGLTRIWLVKLERSELDRETLQVVGATSLADELKEQGLTS